MKIVKQGRRANRRCDNWSRTMRPRRTDVNTSGRCQRGARACEVDQNDDSENEDGFYLSTIHADLLVYLLELI